MSQILDQRTQLDKTVKIFDAFYAFESVVNGNEFDIVNGYFVSVVKSKNIAGNMTAALFRIAQQTQLPVLDLLGYIKGTTRMEMDQILMYYLNTFKTKTALYGISAVPQPNQSVARNIVQ